MCGVYHIYAASIKQPKNLDLSYKTDLDFWGVLRGKIHITTELE